MGRVFRTLILREGVVVVLVLCSVAMAGASDRKPEADSNKPAEVEPVPGAAEDRPGTSKEDDRARRSWLVREASLPQGFPEPGPLGQVVVQEYPPHRAALVKGQSRSNGSFMKLFGHIKRNQIAMTAPVEQELSPDGRSMASMAFYYAEPDLGQAGSDQGVEVIDRPAVRVISIGSRGYPTAEARAAASKELELWLATHPQFKATGPMRTMGYNSPFVPAMFRYWELQIPIRLKGEGAGG